MEKGGQKRVWLSAWRLARVLFAFSLFMILFALPVWAQSCCCTEHGPFFTNVCPGVVIDATLAQCAQICTQYERLVASTAREQAAPPMQQIPGSGAPAASPDPLDAHSPSKDTTTPAAMFVGLLIIVVGFTVLFRLRSHRMRQNASIGQNPQSQGVQTVNMPRRF